MSYCSVQVLIAAALICCFQDASGGVSCQRCQRSLVHSHRQTQTTKLGIICQYSNANANFVADRHEERVERESGYIF